MALGYLRYPDVRDREIVFVADDDVWLAGLDGGRAWRLTADHAEVTSPRFSPDGGKIAFTSARDGDNDVYVLDRASSAITRITYWGWRATATVGWLDDDHVLVASGAGESNYGIQHIYEITLDGAAVRLPYGNAMGVALHPDGAVAINTPNARDSSMWKRYRGGTASKLWLDANGDASWERVLPDVKAGCYAISWCGDRLIFSSDLGGDLPKLEQAQLWSVDRTGGDLRQHTHHGFDDGYVRDPRTDGTTIVYHARGVLYAMPGLDAAPRRIDIDLPVDPGTAPVSVKDVGELAPDFGADGSVLQWRGAAYFLTHRAGPARELHNEPGDRARLPRLLGKGGDAVYVVTDGEADALEITATSGQGKPRRIAVGKLGYVLALEPNPAGTKLGVVSHDGRVSLVDVASGRVSTLVKQSNGEPTSLTFSPDGRYLVWRDPQGGEGERGRLLCADTARRNTVVELTDGRFNDDSPAFSRDGKYLAFLSARAFNPNYDTHTFGLSFGDSTQPFLIPLRADEPAPFGPTADGWRISDVVPAAAEESGDAPQSEADKEKPTSRVPEVVIDPEDIGARVLPFPVPVGRYEHLRAAQDGFVWIRKPPSNGTMPQPKIEGVEPPRPVLLRYGLTSRKLDELVGALDTFEVSGDGLRLVVRDKESLTVVPADRKAGDDDPAKITVDVARLRRVSDRRAEWLQMFDENGRIMRDHYWRADMDGVDWDGVLAMYRPVVERVTTRAELVDVLWETVAELNTSHSYVYPPMGEPKPTAPGLLGADIRVNPQGEAVIVRIVPGDSSNPAARSPLLAAGVNARPGDVIVAVDGRPIRGAAGLGEALAGSAGKVVELTLRGERGRAERRVAVVPLASDRALRYEDWVASRAAYVEEHSGGTMGYLHVPDMGVGGWAEMHRTLSRALAKDAVICDVRFNGGGHTSTLVVERLARTTLGWDIARHYTEPITYPFESRRGPIVFVTNQFAGSDGDIVSANVQTAKIGPVIGERSWGGVIGIDGRFTLVDGMRITQPRYSGYFGIYGWGVENYGIDPDIEVVQSPADWDAEVDIQLDVAIAEAQRLLAEHPAATAPELPGPRVTR